MVVLAGFQAHTLYLEGGGGAWTPELCLVALGDHVVLGIKLVLAIFELCVLTLVLSLGLSPGDY